MEDNITFCLVVYNELQRLKIWLEHHKFLKDIIIIDQSSTDGTLEFINSNYPEVCIITTPRFGYFEVDKNMVQSMSDIVFSIDVDEFIDESMIPYLNKLIGEYNAQDFSIFYVRRKNFIEGIDMSQRFGTPMDPQGRDWQGRITFGHKLYYQKLLAHPAPINNAHFLYINPDKVWLEHKRSFDDIMRANLYRIRGCYDQQVVNEHISFVQKVAQALNLSKEQFDLAREKYE